MTARQKTAVVTGASRGIGRATAMYLAQSNYRVFALARNESALTLLATDQPEIRPWVCDLAADTRDRQFEKLAKTVAQSGKGIDVLVHAAGIVERRDHTQLDDASLRRQLEVNLIAPIALTRALMPTLKKNKGMVLAVGSTLALRGAPGMLAYAASKAGLAAACRCLAHEVGADGVRVNSIALGLVDTDMLGLSELDDKAREKLLKLNLQNRAGAPREVAEMIAYLARADYITGQDIKFDGGQLV